VASILRALARGPPGSADGGALTGPDGRCTTAAAGTPTVGR
jgi:hypothetical protein